MVCAQVPQEAFRDFHAVDHPAGHDRQQGQRIVAPQPLELLAQTRRPVLHADLPTVDVGRDQRFAGQGPDVGHQLAHQAGEMRVGRRSAELVAFQAADVDGGRAN